MFQPKYSYEYQHSHALVHAVFLSCRCYGIHTYNTCKSPIHRWEQLHTTGTPPLGVSGYASCHIGEEIFYFAGYCGHGNCYHNSLSCLNTETLAWKELFSTNETSGPMRKASTALLPFDSQLLAIAGKGQEPQTKRSPMAKYSKWHGLVYTNEHHIFNRAKGEQPFSLS